MVAYQLKVQLQTVRPLVWRRVIVPADITFSALHNILIPCMGWMGGHLHAFRFEKKKIDLVHYGDDNDFSTDNIFATRARKSMNDYEVKLRTLLAEGTVFYWDYDFGDGWEHKILVEKEFDSYEGTVPEVIKWKGNCPPEDVGGPHGYQNFLNVLDHPDDPEHEDMRDWADDQGYREYDPGDANIALQHLKSDGYINSIDSLDFRETEDEYYSAESVPNGILYVLRDIKEKTDAEQKKIFEHPETRLGVLLLNNEPADDFYGMLGNLRREDLRGIAGNLDINDADCMKKSELISAITEYKMNEDIAYHLISIAQESRTLFTEIANTDAYIIKAGDFPFLSAIELIVFSDITGYLDGTHIVLKMPNEMKQKYREAAPALTNLEADDAEQTILDEFVAYACAAVNLYGVIAFDAFMQIYSEQAENPLSESAAIEALQLFIKNESDYFPFRMRQKDLIHEDLYELPPEEMKAFKSLSDLYEQRIFPKEEFLKYADYDYCEPSPELRNLRTYLFEKKPHGAEEEVFADMIAEITFSMRAFLHIPELVEIPEAYGIEYENETDRNKFADLVAALYDNIRVWSHNGNTPRELHHSVVPPMTKHNAGPKIGRNDPCPCGSGKKYKKCCGR